MGSGQFILIKGFMNDEFLYDASHTSQLLKAFERHFGGARYELYEACFFLLIETLKDFPKPANDRRVLAVTVVVCIVF